MLQVQCGQTIMMELKSIRRKECSDRCGIVRCPDSDRKITRVTKEETEKDGMNRLGQTMKTAIARKRRSKEATNGASRYRKKEDESGRSRTAVLRTKECEKRARQCDCSS